MSQRLTQREKAERFQALHKREGAFVIPNPWDVGSARILESMGYEALATTSYGFAGTRGRLDGDVNRQEVLDHCRELSAATSVPISADLENGFADDPDRAAETLLLAARAGAVGGSIEDYTGDPSRPIYDFELAVERVRVAVAAVRTLDFPFTLTARAENLFRGVNDLDDTIRRLQAFEEAGADVLYAPGLRSIDEVRAVTRAVSKPVNVLAPMVAGATVAQLADAGAKRISVGGSLYRAVNTELLRVGKEMLERGSFGWTGELVPGAEPDRLLVNG